MSGTLFNNPEQSQYTIALKAAHGTLPPEPVVVRPADITVYSGGEGYLGVVDGSGNSDDAVAENGIPQPGYYITLPEKLANQLTDNLSDNLTFCYDDGNGTTRQWDVSLYGTVEHSSGGASGVNGTVYKLQPHGQGQDPVRVQITDPDTGDYILSDDFAPTASREYEEYAMTIYSGALDAGYVTARLTVGDKTYTLPVAVKPGKLVVRGFQDQTVYAIADSKADMTSDTITALVPANTNYFINRGDVQLTDPEDARLLVDSVIQGEDLVAYLRELYGSQMSGESLVYVPQYLDLVDKTNGNAYLTLEKDTPHTIYWPVPQDYADNGQVSIFHFAVLDRSSNESLDTLLAQQPPQQITPEVVTVGGNHYFKFSPEALATFVLVYEKTPDTPTGGDSGDNSGNSSGGGVAVITPKYPLTVEYGSGSGRYAAGTQTTITAQPAPDGQEFDRWITSNGGTFGDASSPSTTFRMPDHAVTVTALYRSVDAQTGQPDDSGEPSDPQQPTTPIPSSEQEQTGHKEGSSIPAETEAMLEPSTASSDLDDVPQTGDVGHLEFWLTCMTLSLLGLIGLLALRKKSSM